MRALNFKFSDFFGNMKRIAMKQLTVVEGKVPEEKVDEFKHIFEGMKNGPKPDGLLHAYLVKKQNSNICQIVGIWANLESIEKMKEGGPLPVTMAFKKIGVEPTQSIYEILNEGKMQ